MGLTQAEPRNKLVATKESRAMKNKHGGYEALIFVREEVRYWFWVLGLILGRNK